MMEIFANQYIILALTFAVFYYVRRLQYRKGWCCSIPSSWRSFCSLLT